jgi:type I restriction enzyme S subunit
MSAQELITKHIDLWTSAIKAKNTQGRGSSKKRELYGIKKLRELILELAFSGKLCTQSDADFYFEDLLKNMSDEKKKYHQKKGVRLQKFKLIAEHKMEVDHPNSWRSFYFDEVVSYITDFQANGSFSSLKKNVTYFDDPNYAVLVRLTDLRHGLSDGASYKYTDKSGYLYLKKSSIEGGELVVANVGAGVGTTLLIPEVKMPATLAPNMFMVVLSSFINKEYFLHYSQSPQYKNYISLVNTGTGQPKINKTEYKNCRIPFPPIDEQKRIVEKISELMALCDQLEQQTESSLDAHNLLVDTLLTTLTDARDANELSDNWARLSEHFDTLITTDYAVEQLKQTILQLAVQGKLVPQDPNDEPASELLKRIAAEKEQLIKEKKIKKQKPLPPITDEEKPFELPYGWTYIRLDDLCGNVCSGTTPSKSNLNEESGIPFLKVYNIQEQKIDFIDRKLFVDTDTHFGKLKRSNIYPGDVVLNLVGPPLGKVAIVPDSYPEWNCNQNIIVFRPLESRLNYYIYTYLKAQIFLDYIELVGSAGQDFISGTKCRSIVLPMPPLKEQHRIVTKVDKLMALCDQIKACLTDAQTTQLHLTDAIVDEALN